MNRFRLWLLAMLCAAAPLLAGDAIRTERVHFKAGSQGATLTGHLKGRETVDYLLGAQAGQHMTVKLHTDNSGAYFNVLPPGTEEALFVGSTAGDRFDGTLPETGEYRLRVYLMRSAARRGEEARYRLEVHIGADRQAHTSEHAPDFADGLAGGPDFWQVTGVPAGDTLNLRADPSPHAHILGKVGNGAVLRNLGCRMTDGQRWCQVAGPDHAAPRGWVAGHYLRESSAQP